VRRRHLSLAFVLFVTKLNSSKWNPTIQRGNEFVYRMTQNQNSHLISCHQRSLSSQFQDRHSNSAWPERSLIHCEPWRNVRIGLKYASIGTSEASVERLLSEQKAAQGPYGVNFGTETLHARLVARHEYRPPPE
jgi:hypothetical protein